MISPYLLIVGVGLAAANPILQSIQIPGQYPVQACPTCPTQTCPTQTCPSSRPPCQTCQNSYQNVYKPQPILVQPSNNCPCNKQVTVQNPVANPSQDVLNQLVIRRLLSPQPQPQAQMSPAPCNYCKAQKNVPNIINNYIIIPPEYFKANDTKVDKEESVKQRRKGKRRKQSRQRNLQNATCQCEDNDKHSNNKNAVGEHVTPCPCDNENTLQVIGRTKVENTVTINKTANEKLLPESEIPTEIKTISENDKKVKNFQELVPKTSHIEKYPVETKQPKRTNWERTNSLEDAIIKDFCKKHPTVPEEIARSLLKKLLHKTESAEKLSYRPYPLLPFGYGHYDPQMFYPRNDEILVRYNDRFANDRRSKKRKPPRSGRRNKKPKEEIKERVDSSDKKSQKLVEMNPTVINIETETITTEKITTSTENKFKENLTLNDSETQMETPDDFLDKLDQLNAKFAKLNEIETTTVSYNKRLEQYPDLGKEDKVPTLYKNGVDDYYPDFRGDNIPFYASDEECDSKEDKYQFGTDRNGGLDSKRYVNMKKPNHFSHKDETSTEQPFPVSTKSYESYESMKDENEEIRFIIPPHLEIPDFETKQINKNDVNDIFLADDSYSGTAQSNKPEIEFKTAKVFTKDKSGRTNIETVYGHSRVVKYGRDAEAAASDPVITYYLPEDAMTEDHIQLPDGEGIIVVAKSIRDLEDDWE